MSRNPEIELQSHQRQPIRSEHDVVIACQKARSLAESLGFSRDEQVVFVIVTSELSHNILKYAQRGAITLYRASRAGDEDLHGLFIEAEDRGPGIADVDLALTDGYSTGGGLGMGLSGAKRLMDEFEITSHLGEGTSVLTGKWLA